MSRRHRRRKWQNLNNGAVSDHRKHAAAAPLRTPLPRRARSALIACRRCAYAAQERRSGRYRAPPSALPRRRNAKKKERSKMKVRRKINEIDVEKAIKKILAEQGITRKCLNYLAANVDELQADYITSIMGKIKQQVRTAESLSNYRRLLDNNQRYILLIAIVLFRAQMACGTLPPRLYGRMLDERETVRETKVKRITVEQRLLSYCEEIHAMRTRRDAAGNLDPIQYKDITAAIKQRHKKALKGEVVHYKTVSRVYNEWLREHE
jgi:hypothetical protein